MAKSLEQFPLWRLNELLIGKFGEDWTSLEDETLSLDLGLVLSELLLQKVRLLRVIKLDNRSHDHKMDDEEHGWVGHAEPRVSSDPLFLIHSSDIINNQVVEPTVISLPTSLEFAYTVYSLSKLPGGFKHSTMVKEMAEHVMKQDGFSAPAGELSFVDTSKFVDGAITPASDIANKTKAIKAYITHMEDLND